MGQFGAGQTWSPFMDPDVFPNSIEYWGPNGMVFFRNVQLRWMPLKGEHAVTLALERPGASGDQGVISGRVELAGIESRFQFPDLSAAVPVERGVGAPPGGGDPAQHQVGRHAREHAGPCVRPLGKRVGLGHQRQHEREVPQGHPARVDRVRRRHRKLHERRARRRRRGAEPRKPPRHRRQGAPVLGLVAFYDRTWSDKWTSTFGYSRVEIDNSDLQAADEFKTGQYALANALYHPLPFVMFGPEVQWGQRENNSDGWTANDYRVQFSVKCNFGKTWGAQ
jgi:hypothetical protein